MKYLKIFFAGLTLFLFSCTGTKNQEESLIQGLANPIQADKPELQFPSEGGIETIKCLNYESWIISCGYERGEFNGKWEYEGYVLPSLSEDEQLILNGGWYQAVLPVRTNQMTVTVHPNLTDNTRMVTIQMESGDAFGKIVIHQQ